MKKYFSAESVGKGHPDKICDQIADSILDLIIGQDPEARCAIEVVAANRLILIAGEINTKTYVDIISAAWQIMLPLGYQETDFSIVTNINSQSPEISFLVDQQNSLLGAGDQGIVVGYATQETPSLMPLEVILAHQLLERLEAFRLDKASSIPWLKADMKSEVILSKEKGKIYWEKVILALQHQKEANLEILKKRVIQYLLKPLAQEYNLNLPYKIYINHLGSFILGGPMGDTGLSGRKIIVDSYGLAAHHGGGSYSGKDGTKVDRSGAYLARYVAKNMVAAKLAQKLEITFSYLIGHPYPLAISLNSFHSSALSDQELINIIKAEFDLSVSNSITKFNLKKAIFKKTSVYGHFGKSDLAWEKLDKVPALKKYLKN